MKSKILVTFFITGYTLFLSMLIFVFPPLNSILDSTNHGLVSFQLALTKEQMDLVLTDWSGIMGTAIHFIWLDYLFIIGTSIGNYALLSLIGFDGRFTSLSRKNVLLYTAMDSLENVCSLLILYNHSSYSALLVTALFIFALIKFISFIAIYLSLIIIIYIKNL